MELEALSSWVDYGAPAILLLVLIGAYLLGRAFMAQFIQTGMFIQQLAIDTIDKMAFIAAESTAAAHRNAELQHDIKDALEADRQMHSKNHQRLFEEHEAILRGIKSLEK